MVFGCRGISAASLKSSSPSRRVLAVTLRSVFFVEEVALVVEYWHVAQMDAGDGERSSHV